MNKSRLARVRGYRRAMNNKDLLKHCPLLVAPSTLPPHSPLLLHLIIYLCKLSFLAVFEVSLEAADLLHEYSYLTLGQPFARPKHVKERVQRGSLIHWYTRKTMAFNRFSLPKKLLLVVTRQKSLTSLHLTFPSWLINGIHDYNLKALLNNRSHEWHFRQFVTFCCEFSSI